MESKKGDSRMDVASLTRSDSNYFDTQEYVFIRSANNNNNNNSTAQPQIPHPDTSLLPHATTSSHHVQESEQEQEQQEQDEHDTTSSTELAQPTPAKCTLTYCCICTHGLPASFQNPPTWYVVCAQLFVSLSDIV